MPARSPTVTICLTLIACAAMSCAGPGTSPNAPSASGAPATLLLTVVPNPIVEDPTCICGGLPNRVSATGTVSVRETAGIPVRIDGLRATLTNASTGATTFVNDFTAADVSGHTNGVNRIEAGGTLRVIDVGGHYDRSQSGAATLTVEVRATDDRGNVVTTKLAVPVVRGPGR
jgi:hypothetical protein